MKHKICAVLLAVSVFFASLGACPGTVVASAAVPGVVTSILEGIGVLEVINEFLGYLKDGYDLIEAEQKNNALKKVEFNNRISARLIGSVVSLFKQKNNGLAIDPEILDAFILAVSDSNKTASDINVSYGFNISDDELKMLRGDVEHVHNNLQASYHEIAMLVYEAGEFYDKNCSVDDKGNLQVPVDKFKEELDKQNQTITPKNREMKKYSWRDLSPTQVDYEINTCFFARNIFDNGVSCVGTSLEDGIYFQLYQRREGNMYYQPYQYHLYRVKSSLGGNSPIYQYDWHIEPIFYQKLDGITLDTFDYISLSKSDTYGESGTTVTDLSYENISLGIGWPEESYYSVYLSTYKTREDCFTGADIRFHSPLTGCCFYDDFDSGQFDYWSELGFSSMYKDWQGYMLRSDDVSVKLPFDSRTDSDTDGFGHFFRGTNSKWNMWKDISAHDTGYSSYMYRYNACDEECTCDFGFLICSEPFTTTFNFDTTRLPSNATITISGDSVYDYSITDNSTGATSTVNEYVTNNYTYPEKTESTPSGGTGGGVGGNVNVGGNVGVDGNITVGGKVDFGGKVDVNVNVNGNNGGNGNVNDWIDVNSSDVDSNVADYIELVPKLSKNFIDYMKDFFSWLPKEIYGIIIAGLVFLVVRLVFCRR